MRASAFSILLIALLGGNAAAACDLMQDRAAAKRWQAQRAASTSPVPPRGLTRFILPPVTPPESEQAILLI